jgi:hypothetical protein
MVEPDRSQMTTRRMRFACWITKAANTHSEYVTLLLLSTVTMVRGKPFNVTLYGHTYPVLFNFIEDILSFYFIFILLIILFFKILIY